MPKDAKVIAATYFSSWRAHDFDTFRSPLAADVEFAGPMGQAHGADECVAGIEGMSTMVTDMGIHVEVGKITRIRVAFDPRPIAPPSARG